MSPCLRTMKWRAKAATAIAALDTFLVTTGVLVHHLISSYIALSTIHLSALTCENLVTAEAEGRTPDPLVNPQLPDSVREIVPISYGSLRQWPTLPTVAYEVRISPPSPRGRNDESASAPEVGASSADW